MSTMKFLSIKFTYGYTGVLSVGFYYDTIKRKFILRSGHKVYDEIKRLKKEKDVVILAHYYVDEKVQKISDYVGDSYYLAKIAREVTQKTILFSGVYFMAESAKILNPEKKVLLPDDSATCPMAHMGSIEKIQQMRKEIQDLAVVCYINSTARLKAHSDICVTSSNGVKIVRNLPQKNIYFTPDAHLGQYIASLVPEKNFYFNDGYCPIHQEITRDDVENLKRQYPNALILAHPECSLSVLKLADYVGSTSGIIDYASNCDDKEMIICTESGVFYELERINPHKKFYRVIPNQICSDMKKITIEKVLESLKEEKIEVEVSEELRRQALIPLNRMMELA